MSQVDLTKLTTPFGLLDPDTQEALRKWEHGWDKWVYDGVDGDCDWRESGGVFTDALTYRARPAPLVPETIDWSHVAPEWKWMARDEGADWGVLYEQNPYIENGGWVQLDGDWHTSRTHASYRRGTVAWQDSLVQRPE